VYRLIAHAILLALAYCTIIISSDGHDRDLLECNRHWDQWRALQIHSYVFEYDRTCFCSTDVTRLVRIEVRGDAVVRVTDVQTGGDVTAAPFARWPTIDSLFIWTRRTISDGDWRYRIDYHPAFHYVRRLSGDVPNVIDGGFVQTVHSFLMSP
jgi:hypothetical protein